MGWHDATLINTELKAKWRSLRLNENNEKGLQILGLTPKVEKANN
jgi:hypothetical protein